MKYIALILTLIASICFEAWGLYSVLGASPYILIVFLIAYFKFFFREKKVYVFFIITLFFSIQKPLESLIKKDDFLRIAEITNERIARKQVLVYDNIKFKNSGAWGLYKQNALEIQKIDEEIKDLHKVKKPKNKYLSFIEILCIFLVEYSLYYQLINFNKKRKIKKTKEIL